MGSLLDGENTGKAESDSNAECTWTAYGWIVSDLLIYVYINI